ncbi:MAG: 4Fe-4S dicluster domain-containing protein [Deltaproteobacteria bacterium]|nr:4Fe-4S dicluster domain-containing protein [Deltaproteobacteria bacterium]
MGKEEKAVEMEVTMIPVYIMGKKYEVPAELTIMKALEHAGYQYIRGCGCRGGICGACATVYRKAGDYKIYTGLACQTVVEPDMYLAQIPFYPANRATYDFEKIEATPEAMFQLYPELFRCVACNACTKVCPMDVEVMDYIAQLKRGDIKKAAQTSFDCIQCGLCTSRCMGELMQYHMAQLARRLAGAKLTPRSGHMADMVEKINGGAFDNDFDSVKKLELDDLKKVYTEREMEPHMGNEDWQPESKTGLVS